MSTITPDMWVRTTEDAVSLHDSTTSVPKGTELYVVATDDTSDDPDSTGDLFITAEWLGMTVYLDDTVLEAVQGELIDVINAARGVIGVEVEDVQEEA